MCDLRNEIQDLKAANEALLKNLERISARHQAEVEEIEALHKLANRQIAEELQNVRATAEIKLVANIDAHSKTVKELQEMIESLVAARSAESKLAQNETEHLGKEIIQLLSENEECFKMLDTFVPRSELESARFVHSIFVEVETFEFDLLIRIYR